MIKFSNSTSVYIPGSPIAYIFFLCYLYLYLYYLYGIERHAGFHCDCSGVRSCCSKHPLKLWYSALVHDSETVSQYQDDQEWKKDTVSNSPWENSLARQQGRRAQLSAGDVLFSCCCATQMSTVTFCCVRVTRTLSFCMHGNCLTWALCLFSLFYTTKLESVLQYLQEFVLPLLCMRQSQGNSKLRNRTENVTSSDLHN